jgi:hypothetical protein
MSIVAPWLKQAKTPIKCGDADKKMCWPAHP